MSKKSKYRFWKGADGDDYNIEKLRRQCFNNRINKYYNLWMSSLKWNGLDDEIKAQQENYIMRKAWSEGFIAVRKIDNTDMLAFMPWTVHTINMYDYPATVNLVNERSVSTSLIPNTPQVVGKDVVIGWFQPSHKPIYQTVKHYVDRMVQVDMVINTNLALQNLPFLVAVSEDDQKKMTDLVQRILNNELVVFADLESLQNIQTVATQTPYIIDKLRSYLTSLEDELLSFLGIDNNGGNDKTHLTIDAVNANNDLINQYKYSIQSEMNKWIEQANKLFGRSIAIEDAVQPQVESIHEEGKEAQENEATNN